MNAKRKWAKKKGEGKKVKGEKETDGRGQTTYPVLKQMEGRRGKGPRREGKRTA